MTDEVLLLKGHLGKCLCLTLSTEDWIVTEALPVGMRLFGDDATADAFKFGHLLVHDKLDDGSELSRTIMNVLHVAKQLIVVGISIMVEALIAGIAGRTYTRLHAKGANLKARVIGKTIYIIMNMHEFGFLEGIA